MAKNKKTHGSSRVARLPEHGPITENGREILLRLKNVDITFGKGDNKVRAVKNASFDIYKGEIFSLVGDSGSGKTAIGRAVIRDNPCAGGEIQYKGVRISGKIPRSLGRKVNRSIRMISGTPADGLNERVTVDDIISEGLYGFRLFINQEARAERVEKIIADVGLLPEHLTRYLHEFSAGQRQRIGLARAMVMEPELVIADDPICALDISVRAQVLNLLKKFQKERDLTCLFISHDLSVVRLISDRIGVIYKGNIVEVADAQELFDFPLHPYTRSLICAMPIPDPILEKNKVLLSYDPSVHDYSEEKPKLIHIGNNHYVHGNKKEIEAYMAIREKGEKGKTVTVFDPHDPLGAKQASVAEQSLPVANCLLEYPIHDTGSKWYAIGSFFLPPIGLIAGLLFKKFRHICNYKACMKGALIGFGAMAGFALVALLLLLFLMI